MDKKHFYREIIWECGCYTAVSIFPVYKRPGVRRSKCKPTSEIQKFLNDKHSREHLKRLVHLNFTKDDYFIGLDYMQSCLPNDDAVAKRDVQNWLRRIKRLYQRYGGELKYIMAYERAERGRPHFHVIINNIGVPEKLIRDTYRKEKAEDALTITKNENGFAVEIAYCPAVKHLHNIGHEVSPWFRYTTEVVMATLAAECGAHFEMLSYDEESGASRYTFKK